MSAITEIQIPQGTDARIPVRYKNPDGTPKDLSSLAGYGTFISDDKGSLLLKWSKNTLPEYGVIVETDAANGEFYFDFTAEQNKNLAPGYYLFELKEQSTLDGSPWRQASIQAKIIRIMPSSSNGVLVLV